LGAPDNCLDTETRIWSLQFRRERNINLLVGYSSASPISPQMGHLDKAREQDEALQWVC
jgi:hypothetical protein